MGHCFRGAVAIDGHAPWTWCSSHSRSRVEDRGQQGLLGTALDPHCNVYDGQLADGLRCVQRILHQLTNGGVQAFPGLHERGSEGGCHLLASTTVEHCACASAQTSTCKRQWPMSPRRYSRSHKVCGLRSPSWLAKVARRVGTPMLVGACAPDSHYQNQRCSCFLRRTLLGTSAPRRRPSALAPWWLPGCKADPTSGVHIIN